MDEIENTKIMSKCPRFDYCDVPICPLNHYQESRVYSEGESKCTMEKGVRAKIGKGTELKYQGFVKREWAAKKNWENKSEEEKQIIIERGKRALGTLTSL